MRIIDGDGDRDERIDNICVGFFLVLSRETQSRNYYY